MVTDEDVNMVQYYWLKSGSPEHWGMWEERKEVIFEKYPALKAALESQAAVQQTLDMIITQLDPDEEEPS